MDEPSRGKKWLAAIVMVIATIVAIAWSIAHMPANVRVAPSGAFDAGALGYAMGRTAVETIVAWAIASAVAGFIQGRLWVWRSGIFLPVMIVAVFAADLAILFGPSLTPAGHDRAAFNKLTQEIQAQAISDRDAYLKELYNLGYPDFLHPASLGAPDGLERAQRKIKIARAIVKKYRERNDASLVQFRAAIARLNIRTESKKQALAGFDASVNASNADRAKLWQLQDAVMAEYQAMLDDLAASRHHWHTDADKIVFSRQRDLDTFNRHIHAAVKLEHEATTLMQKIKADHEPPQPMPAKR